MCLFQECVKFVVLAFNLIFVLVGVALITIGTIYKIHFNDITEAIPTSYNHFELIPILTIVVGSIIFIIAFFGCCGALKSSPCLLTTYAIILLTIFILQIALGVFALLEIKNKNDLRSNVNNTIDQIFHKNSTKNELIDFIQKELECCGTFGPKFWTDSMGLPTQPKSCCPNEDCSQSSPYTDGCQTNFYNFLLQTATVIGIVVLALAATEVIGATISLCLANSARNEMRRQGYY